MYEVDELDRVVELPDFPQSSVGAPLPIVLATEHAAVAGFLLEEGQHPRSVSEVDDDQTVAIVRFRGVKAHYFGMPNDEAFAGHPLASRGLGPYGAYLIEHSSWIRRLDKMQSVHPNHSPRFRSGLKHIVLSFHDSTFECVCSEYAMRIRRGSLREAEGDMLALVHC